MIVIPAIDIRGGKVVRLTQGAGEKETVYNDSPLSVAKEWESCGASLIHVVDLDGALEGNFRNLELVGKIASGVRAKIEMGGGIRDEITIRMLLEVGVEKVVLGTKALDDDFLKNCIAKFGKRIVVGADARDGMIHTKGWLFKTKMRGVDFARRAERMGAHTINYTDISRDGMLTGPNLNGIQELLDATSLDIVAGGGISSIGDVKRLKALSSGRKRLAGIIIGKALYEKTIDLREAISVCSQKE